MSEFCKQCAEVMFGPEHKSSFIGQTTAEDWAVGKAAVVLCEDCGPIQVDPDGVCISQECDQHRVPMTLGQILSLGENSGYPLVFTLTYSAGTYTAKLVGSDRVVASAEGNDAGMASKRLLAGFTAACKELAA